MEDAGRGWTASYPVAIAQEDEAQSANAGHGASSRE